MLTRRGGKPSPKDIGPFELLEACAVFEGKAAAQAANQITDEEITELEKRLAEMESVNKHDVVRSENVDKRFHLITAQATKNSAIEERRSRFNIG